LPCYGALEIVGVIIIIIIIINPYSPKYFGSKHTERKTDRQTGRPHTNDTRQKTASEN